MEMKGDKSHDTDHRVKQEQNDGVLYFRWSQQREAETCTLVSSDF